MRAKGVKTWSCAWWIAIFVLSLFSIRQTTVIRENGWPAQHLKEVEGHDATAHKNTTAAVLRPASSCPEEYNLSVVLEYPLAQEAEQDVSPDEAIRAYYWHSQQHQPFVEEARCRFDDYPNIFHFPHAMQFLLPCWSYWRSFVLKNETTVPVLVWNGKGEQALSKVRSYTTAFLNELQEKIGLQIVFDDFKSEAALPTKILSAEQSSQLNRSMTVTPKQSYFVANRTHDTRALVHVMTGISPQAQVPHASCDRPRIRILNRQGARTLSNAQELALLLHNNSSKVTYFENATFLEQIHMMATTDILVTGHGAQMTSVWAMPRCGQAMEIFPRQYWTPRFFGSLAALAGVRHVAMGYDTTWHTGSEKYEQRVAARSVALCPPLEQVLHMVQNDLVPHWRSCCEAIRRDDVGQ